ncbi:MAG: hypothetical protein CMJ89_06980 [Planctomycetes bacterium]|jgi:hypothetical protein|nr:hypothetical protein [Planctomycetota bacterium]
MNAIENNFKYAGSKTGIALVPAMVILSGMAIFTMALLTVVTSGKKTVMHQGEEFRISSAVESVAALSMEHMWSNYIALEGAAGDIKSFRDYLSDTGILDSGPGGPPTIEQGLDLVPFLDLPDQPNGKRFNDVNIDAAHLVRRDVGDSTQLYLTVQASTTRGEDIVNPILNRAVQQAFTVEPADFAGFDYALLANNVNCIFCHTSIDSADRYWDTNASDPEAQYEHVQVGTLESLLVRHNADGNTYSLNDFDADSYIAGALFLRGIPALDDGNPIPSWDSLSLMGYEMDSDGFIVEAFGGLTPVSLDPTLPTDPLGNLYLDYPTNYAEMSAAGVLPVNFPAPFPDDGGIVAATGLPDPSAADNRVIDDIEFDRVAQEAYGEITAGIISLFDESDVIDTPLDYAGAVGPNGGNSSGMASVGSAAHEGNVLLTGWPNNPIEIDGSIVIDGDLIIQGHIKGEGTIYVRGNIYIPSSLMYADGVDEQSLRTFGLDAEGNTNALGLTAGGNIVIGDFQRPASLQPNFSWSPPDEMEIISGNPDTGDVMVDQWSFALSEISLFNRGEWSKAQSTLPGPDGDPVTNPGYVPNYIPRYYHYGDDSTIPIYNGTDPWTDWHGNVHHRHYFDPDLGTWVTPSLLDEVPLGWDTDKLTYADPTDPSDPILYNGDGSPRAVTTQLQHEDGWMEPSVYKAGVEWFEDQLENDTPFRIDGLLYTNNAIFGIVNRNTKMEGRMLVNGGLVAADIGLLVPGRSGTAGDAAHEVSPDSGYAFGLQLNYDGRTREMLRIVNPLQVQLKRTLWNPTANLF